MRDIVPSVDDRKRLVVLLAQLFPDNDSARRLLDLVRYPSRRWPGFTGKPIEGWQETLRDFDESRPDDAAYHFVFHHRYGSTGNPGRILCWAAPQDEGRAENGHLSSARGVFTRRQNTDINISLSPEDFDTFERTLVSLYKSNPEKSRSLMKFAGFPSELRNELIGNDQADWHNAFIALDNGQVSQKETPFRRMLEWASRDCPGNAELQRLAEKYLDSGGVGR